jgi:hypothetical protein
MQVGVAIKMTVGRVGGSAREDLVSARAAQGRPPLQAMALRPSCPDLQAALPALPAASGEPEAAPEGGDSPTAEKLGQGGGSRTGLEELWPNLAPVSSEQLLLALWWAEASRAPSVTARPVKCPGPVPTSLPVAAQADWEPIRQKRMTKARVCSDHPRDLGWDQVSIHIPRVRLLGWLVLASSVKGLGGRRGRREWPRGGHTELCSHQSARTLASVSSCLGTQTRGPVGRGGGGWGTGHRPGQSHGHSTHPSPGLGPTSLA